ncbi:transposase [Paraburkholderia xenovorans]
MLERGAISRFASVGQLSSYCRCVDRRRISNGRKKGEGNTKNGNRYLAWAFIEAAGGALRVILPGAGHDHGYRGKQSHAAMAREAFRVSREECSAGGGILQPACKPRGGNGRGRLTSKDPAVLSGAGAKAAGRALVKCRRRSVRGATRHTAPPASAPERYPQLA